MICRTEGSRKYYLAGSRVVTVTLRDAIAPEDPYLSLAKAKAFSVRTGEVVNVNRTSRTIKNYLIKTNVSI